MATEITITVTVDDANEMNCRAHIAGPGTSGAVLGVAIGYAAATANQLGKETAARLTAAGERDEAAALLSGIRAGSQMAVNTAEVRAKIGNRPH